MKLNFGRSDILSLIETYRRTIKRKKDELNRLRNSKATELGKIPSHKKKLHQLKQL